MRCPIKRKDYGKLHPWQRQLPIKCKARHRVRSPPIQRTESQLQTNAVRWKGQNTKAERMLTDGLSPEVVSKKLRVSILNERDQENRIPILLKSHFNVPIWTSWGLFLVFSSGWSFRTATSCKNIKGLTARTCLLFCTIRSKKLYRTGKGKGWKWCEVTKS